MSYQKINKLFYLLGFVLLTSVILKAQDDTINVPDEVNSYLNLLTGYSLSIHFDKNMDTMSTDRLKSYANILFEATEKDAMACAKIFDEKNSEADSLDYLWQKGELETIPYVKPSRVWSNLREKVMKQLGNIPYALIFNDYLLKVKIDSVYNENSAQSGTLTFVKVSILSILKGNSRFSENQIVTFYLNPGWRTASYGFTPGEIYFVTLWIMPYDMIRLNVLISNDEDGSFGQFPVNQGMLIDRDNFWGLGEKVPWEVFEKELKKTIAQIKSWR